MSNGLDEIIHVPRGKKVRVSLGRISRFIELAPSYRVVYREDGSMTWHPIECTEVTWVPVKGFPGYELSDQGFVRDKETQRILSPRHNSRDGGVLVRLRLDHADHEIVNSYGGDHPMVWRSLANLVLESFGSPCPGSKWAPYREDGDHLNNALENLYWGKRVDHGQTRWKASA